MSEAVKIQELGSTQPVSESKLATVDKTIPEPVVAEPSRPDQSSTTAINIESSTEGPATEKNKENEKSDDLARTILKGFQNRLAGVFPKKSEKATETKDEKKEDSTEPKDDLKEEEKEVKERRSGSRKRNSFFGGLGLGKKEEKVESEENATADTPKDASTEPVQSTEVNSEQPTVTTEVTTHSEAPHDKPIPVKRTSIFGTLKSQFVRKEKSDSTNTTVKESENVAATAPIIPEVSAKEIPAAEATTEAIIDKAQEPQASVESKSEKTAKDRRKSGLPFGLGLGKKEKPTSSDDEAHEKPLSPFARIRATVRSKTSPKHAPEKKEETNVSATTKTEGFIQQPIVSEPTVTTASPTVAASA